MLAPKVEALASDLLDGPAREEVRKRAAAWVETRIRLGLSELMDARATAESCRPARAASSSSSARVSASCRAGRSSSRWPSSSEEDRKALAKLGVRVGVYLALFPEHAEAGADPPARRPLDDGAQPRDDPAAAGRGPHLDGSAARRRARFLRRDRLPAARQPRDPRRHGRAPGRDGAPGRARKPREPRAARSRRSRKKPRPRRRPSRADADARRRCRRAAPSTDEISEWAIVAAAFGESEPAPAPRPSLRPKPRRRRTAEPIADRREAATEPVVEPRAATEESRRSRAEAERCAAEAAAPKSRRPKRRPSRKRRPKTRRGRRSDGRRAAGRKSRSRKARGRCRRAGSAPRRR